MGAAAPAPVFEKRADRALLLARDNAAAAEPLRFAAALFRLMGRFAAALAARHRDRPLAGHPAADFEHLADLLPGLLALARTEGPPELAEEAAARAADAPETAKARLVVYWEGGVESSGDYLSRALLRPWGETLAAVAVPPGRLHREGHCPFCAGRPIVSFRRSEPESQGGTRYLVCGLCGTEWPFGRIRCPTCQEADPPKLPAFQSEAHKGVRIEACDTCRRYVKSIDLTLDMRPIPEVDDVGSIAMDLWAIEQGYTRCEPGWAGI
ncbi:MAG: formate dehydrogenase accessory protein FdhE [Acidithiobacillales bacterium]